MSARHDGDLTEEHADRRWRDGTGHVWYYDASIPSWGCEGRVLAAVIWDIVPRSHFGPFTEVT